MAGPSYRELDEQLTTALAAGKLDWERDGLLAVYDKLVDSNLHASRKGLLDAIANNPPSSERQTGPSVAPEITEAIAAFRESLSAGPPRTPNPNPMVSPALQEKFDELLTVAMLAARQTEPAKEGAPYSGRQPDKTYRSRPAPTNDAGREITDGNGDSRSDYFRTGR